MFLFLLCHGDGYCDYLHRPVQCIPSCGDTYRLQSENYDFLSKDGDKNKKSICIPLPGTFFTFKV
jgi:hypothetical protein